MGAGPSPLGARVASAKLPVASLMRHSQNRAGPRQQPRPNTAVILTNERSQYKSLACVERSADAGRFDAFAHTRFKITRVLDKNCGHEMPNG